MDKFLENFMEFIYSCNSCGKLPALE